MTNQNAEKNEAVLQKLKHLEDTIQDQETDTTELKGVVNELRVIVQSLDKEMAIQVEKQSHLNYKIEQISKQIELLEEKGVKSSDKQRALVENALMAFLGGLITYLFSLLGGK